MRAKVSNKRHSRVFWKRSQTNLVLHTCMSPASHWALQEPYSMLSCIGKRSKKKKIEFLCLSTSLKPQSQNEKLSYKTTWFLADSQEKGMGHQLTWTSIFSLRARSSCACLSLSSDSSSRSDPRLDPITLWDCSAFSFWKGQRIVLFRWKSNHNVVFSYLGQCQRRTPYPNHTLVLTSYLHAGEYSHKSMFPFSGVLLRAQALHRKSNFPWKNKKWTVLQCFIQSL